MAKRKVEIGRRQVVVGKVSAFNPDKHGDKLEPARDMKLEILLEKGETAQFFGMAKGGLDGAFWNEIGDPLLPQIESLSAGTSIKVDGKATLTIIGHKKGNEIECMLGRVVVSPQAGYRAVLKCNLHFNPTGIAEECDRMALEEKAVLEFSGSIRKEEPAEGDKDPNQGDLPV